MIYPESHPALLAWLYGSGRPGFPKSLDVSKAIDRAAGVEREVVGYSRGVVVDDDQGFGGIARGAAGIEQRGADIPITAPATDDAARWEGWGTALKPAFEPIVVARKPLAGTVAANVLAHGVGALNVDGCRIAFAGEADEAESKGKNRHADFGSGARENRVYGADARARGEHGNYDPPGRWPANVTLDEEAAAMLDQQTGELSPGYWAAGGGRDPLYGGGIRAHVGSGARGEGGGASRFFYVAKASRAERNAGLDGFEARMPHDNAGHVHADGRAWDVPGSHSTARANHHPTVKPVALMRWLVRLVTPPGGTVLDPFLGSGTTGIAAVLEGFDFVGIEREPDYLPIAEARIRFWQEHGDDGLRIVRDREAAEAQREAIADSGQTDIFAMLDLTDSGQSV